MALSLRLKQMGRKNAQTFRLVVIDKRAPRDGKYIEMLGYYNPLLEGDKSLSIKNERLDFWVDQGAQMSDKVRSLVKKACPEVIKKLNDKKLAKIQTIKAKKKK